MQFSKQLVMLSALIGALAIGQSAYAKDVLKGHDAECRSGKYNPIVGVWNGNLEFTTLGKATVLVSINQGGTFTETDSVDLDRTVGVPSPGYAAWKAKDCRNYTVTINKTIYNPDAKQFFTVVLPGTIVLSDDGQSWTVNLKQRVFDASGKEIQTGSVTGIAKRVIAGSDE
jgi:hypothetical protein